jgi:bacterioferritin-associated ferredoxin
MRCVDVIRELAAPTDTQNAADLADHLSRCSSCAKCATEAAQFDRLWNTTRPAEPSPALWENLWSQVACSLENSTLQESASPSPPESWNYVLGTSVSEPEPRPTLHSPALSLHARLWPSASMVSLARAAGVLLVAGLTLWFIIPFRQKVAPLNPVSLGQTAANAVASPLPSVDIEPGHMVVILAHPNSPSVVDRTPKAIIAGIGREYVDWYGDERSFDWSQVFNEAEYLATPKVAMKE